MGFLLFNVYPASVFMGDTGSLLSLIHIYAMLGKEVVFIGMGKRAEIWDKARWDAKNAEVEADIEDIASEMEASGFSI